MVKAKKPLEISLTQLLSPTMVDLLVVFFRQPTARFYLTELVKITGKYPNSVNQAIKTLVKLGLITPINQDQLKFYSLNENNPLVSDLENMLIKAGSLDRARSWTNLADWLKAENIPYTAIDNHTISLGKKNPLMATPTPDGLSLSLPE